jgi:hypothetical protein
MRTGTIAAMILALACVCTGAFGYSFWGITLGTDSYQNMNQLTFNGVGASGAQYAVGGYKYTWVDDAWYGPYTAATPGEGFSVHRKMDAQALFFMADDTAAHFVIITGMPQTGVAIPECGYGSRLIGPGDLRILLNGSDFGVGLRLDNVLWAVDPNTTSPEFQIHKSQGGVDDIHASDVGTLGRVEQNPQWDRVDNPDLPSNTEASHAFYVAGSGATTGSATIAYEDTGTKLYGARVYAYKVDVPWTALLSPSRNYELRALWGPACGNDLIAGTFRNSIPGGPVTVPEPGTIICLSAAIVGLWVYRKRYASKTQAA